MNANEKDNLRKMEQGMSDAGQNVRNAGKAAGRMAEDAASDVKQGFNDMSDSVSNAAQSMKDSASDAMDEGRSRAGEMLSKARDTAQDAKDAIVSGAGSTLSAVKDVAVEKADAARESLSDVGQRLAATLERASADGDEDALKSRMLTSVAQGLTSVSDALRSRSVTELTSDVKQLAKKHPGAFMAAAAVVGFAAARFARSSSNRRMADRDHNQGPRV